MPKKDGGARLSRMSLISSLPFFEKSLERATMSKHEPYWLDIVDEIDATRRLIECASIAVGNSTFSGDVGDPIQTVLELATTRLGTLSFSLTSHSASKRKKSEA
jgi:hypothetical protein